MESGGMPPLRHLKNLWNNLDNNIIPSCGCYASMDTFTVKVYTCTTETKHVTNILTVKKGIGSGWDNPDNTKYY